MGPCELLVDVGTQHALIPLAALERGLAKCAIGIDRSGPITEARVNWEAAGKPPLLALHESMGLASVADLQPDVLVIAGMGGRSIVGILHGRPPAMPLPARIILQPQSEVPQVRRWARANGLHLRDERLVEENGRLRFVLAFSPGEGPDPVYAPRDGTDEVTLDALGPWLLRRLDPRLLVYARAQAERHIKKRTMDEAFWRAVVKRLEEGKRVR